MIKTILDTIADRLAYYTNFNYSHLYQGLKEGELVYDGASFSPSSLSDSDVHVIYYRNIYFICKENFILFFQQTMLTAWLNGTLDEFWGLFPPNYEPIVYEEDILEMSQYFVDKEALKALAESLQVIPSFL